VRLVHEALTQTEASPYVLVIDDEAFFRQLLSDELERRGYTVLTARDASETFRFFERAAGDDSPVIVVLDLMLPGMNGIELLHGLATQVGTKVRFILCSSHGVLNKVAPSHPLIAGRVAKPIEPEALDAALATAASALSASMH
jgi:CheY-like chemotaxis protein